MAANSGDLAQSLIEGGLSATAARIIANALANAQSPQLSAGNDRIDNTPKEQLRLITPDIRRYQLPNLDYSPSEPFQKRLSSNQGKYLAPSPDHPYTDSQPLSPTPPIGQRAVRGSDYITVTNTVENNASVAEVSLDLRLDVGGRHLRLDPSTKSIESVPLIAKPELPRFMASEFRETENGTELIHGFRNLVEVEVPTNNGDSRIITAFSDSELIAGGAFGGWNPYPKSFLPTFTAGTAPTAMNYESRYGGFFKIGNLVLFYGFLRMKTFTIANNNQNVRIGGFPYNCVSDRLYSIFVGSCENWATYPTNGWVFRAANGQTVITLRAGTNATANANQVQYTQCVQDPAGSNGSSIWFSGFYETSPTLPEPDASYPDEVAGG